MVEQYSDCDFETLLAKYDYNFKRGDIVKGIVCAYEADGAIVDIGSKVLRLYRLMKFLLTEKQKLKMY